MIRNQLSLFKIESEQRLIKNIDFIDISKIKAINAHSFEKKIKYDFLEENHYILYKTGRINIWRKELGPIFPYIKNIITNKILKFSVSKTYVRGTVYNRKTNQTLNLNIHRLVAEAFIENPDPEKFNIVNHINKDRLDYRVDNLEWTTQSLNCMGALKPRDDNYEIRQIKNGVV